MKKLHTTLIATLALFMLTGCTLSITFQGLENGGGGTASTAPSTPKTTPTKKAASKNVLYGKASYYGKKFHGRKTANGERFSMWQLTAAHKTLPFGTKCRVTNLDTGKSVVVRINDRGPFVKGRVIDLSKKAMADIGGVQKGVVPVRIDIISYGKK